MWDRAWILIVRGQVHNDKVWGRCKVGGGWRQGEAGAAGVGWKLGHFKVTGGGGGRGVDSGLQGSRSYKSRGWSPWAGQKQQQGKRNTGDGGWSASAAKAKAKAGWLLYSRFMGRQAGLEPGSITREAMGGTIRP
jgi:hypothetical protein